MSATTVASSANAPEVLVHGATRYAVNALEFVLTSLSIVVGACAVKLTNNPLFAFPVTMAANAAAFELCRYGGYSLGMADPRNQEPRPLPRRTYREAGAVGLHTLLTGSLANTGSIFSADIAIILGAWIWVGPRFHGYAVREGLRSSGVNLQIG